MEKKWLKYQMKEMRPLPEEKERVMYEMRNKMIKKLEGMLARELVNIEEDGSLTMEIAILTQTDYQK